MQITTVTSSGILLLIIHIILFDMNPDLVKGLNLLLYSMCRLVAPLQQALSSTKQSVEELKADCQKLASQRQQCLRSAHSLEQEASSQEQLLR